MPLWSPDSWLAAWTFAADAHHGQRVPSSRLPYVVHVGAVAMEVAHAVSQRAHSESQVARPDLAIQCALLHDVVEDTKISAEQIEASFGRAVADGVRALSKDPLIGDKPVQMRDSLARIRLQPPEVWMVKLGDRITNLQPPPAHWDLDKIRRYRAEAIEIHAQLGEACEVLGARLLVKIDNYEQYT